MTWSFILKWNYSSLPLFLLIVKFVLNIHTSLGTFLSLYCRRAWVSALETWRAMAASSSVLIIVWDWKKTPKIIKNKHCLQVKLIEISIFCRISMLQIFTASHFNSTVIACFRKLYFNKTWYLYHVPGS